MWHLFIPEIPILEKIFRTGVIYLFLLIAFRFTGKRQVGQLTPFDLVVLLVISNIVQNALIGNDTSIGGGLIGVVTILVLNALFVELTFRSSKARHILEQKPTLLIHNGHILQANMNRERINIDELLQALREHSLTEPGQVRIAILEEDGKISVIPKIKT